MAASDDPLELIDGLLDRLPMWIDGRDDAACGPVAVKLLELSDRSAAMAGAPLRRFERSRAWAAEGALNLVAWLRSHAKLSGGSAMERVAIARQLEHLPATEQAFQRGELGLEHVATLRRTVEHVGIAAVQKAEAGLLEAAKRHDPGQFVTVAKEFEHREDAEAALRESNRAFSRRYLRVSEPKEGLVHLDGLLDAEGGAILKTALDRLMPPPAQTDDRTAGQRRADAIVDLARTALDGGKLGSTGRQRPHLVITASLETLAGVPGAPPARMEGVGPIALATAERYACDSTVSWLLARAEFESETGHAHRQIPPSTRRALVARDRACVFHGCDRPAGWCDGHHLVFWSRGGETKLENLALVCGRHHRMLHEEGWTLQRSGGRWVTRPPGQRVPAHARSA